MLGKMLVGASLSLFVATPAMAMDVGEIALLPDDGTIISNAFLLDQFVAHAACAFYRQGTHGDDYDAIFVWTSAQLNALTRTQMGWPVRAAAHGIGYDGWFDLSSSFCAHRLRHAVKMGDIDSFTDDPDAIYTGAYGFTLSGIQLMGHEFGHQFMAGVTFKGTDGIRHCLIRGYTDSSGGEGGGSQLPQDDCDGHRNSDFNLHWSAYFNTGSVMYGNHIEDVGGGNFVMTNHDAKYTPLDQYLMGLRDPSEVPPQFVVDTGGVDSTSAAFPVAQGSSQMISGTRLDFTIDDVIRAEGPRVPARDMCHWKAAFIIVHPPNAPPTPQQIARVDAYRRRWETWYPAATDQRGSFDTTLAGTGLGTSGCAGAPTPHGDGGIALDSGAAVPDASAIDAAPSSAIDAGIEPRPEPDAGRIAAADASAGAGDGPMYSDEPPRGNGNVRVLKADGCSCNATRVQVLTSTERRRGSVLLATLLFAVLRIARPRGTRSRARSRADGS